jgi:acetoin utilization deacetylase AcuC-like enzyme
MVFKEILKPAALEFEPDIVLVSAGHDPHKADPLGGMKLTTTGFGAMAGVVKEIADICCRGRLAATLEGGYNLEAQAEAVVAEIRAFRGIVPDIKGVDPSIAKRIEEVKKAQSAYWSCFK